jgi:hypothetical protein
MELQEKLMLRSMTVNSMPNFPKKPDLNTEEDSSPKLPQMPSKPIVSEEPKTIPTLPKMPSTKPVEANKLPSVKPKTSQSLIPEDALYNAETDEYFDAATGYKINPKNGLLIIPDMDSVKIPSPSLPKNPRAIPDVDTEVDLVVITAEDITVTVAKELIPETIDVGDWDDDSDNDPAIGLGAEREKVAPVKKPRLGKGLNITDRDIIMMKFLARYRYAYVDQLARLVNSEPKDIKPRLKKLESEGLVRSEAITAGQDIYLTRKAGNAIIDIDFPEIKKGQVSFITIAHTIGLGNLGVELEMSTGGKNILGEDDFPVRNRYFMGLRDPYSEPTELGEMTVTEREIRRGNRLFRGDKTTEDMRLLAEAAFADPSGPEMLEGNEGLFVVYGKGKDGEHVPDLVVARPRGENGEVEHIAIELELTPKNNAEWSRILRWYRDHGFMYKKIYYFTHKRTIGDALKKAAQNVGVEDRLVIRKYIPQNDRGPFWG